MSEYRNFEVDFISCSLELIKQYEDHVMPNVPHQSQYEVTLLINCLLGLLVLPKERHLSKIPDTPLTQTPEWGIQPNHIVNAGKNCEGERRMADTITLRQVVTDMRHSVAHILFKPYGDGQQIKDIELRTDRSKFKAKLSVTEFKSFVQKLAEAVIDRGAGA